METQPEKTKPRGGGIAIPWVLVLMAGSFVAGGFVGLHPSWLPIPMSYTGSSSDDAPAAASVNSARPAQSPTTASTQPTTQGE